MPTRRLMTKRLYNARDIGGYPAENGLVTRFGVFIRSEAPCLLPEEDISYLRNYGITASMDFRSSMEVNSRPSDLAAILPYYHRPLFNEAAIPGDREKKRPAPGPIDWGLQYISMAEDSRSWALDVLQLAAENEGALLYHCTTGKDRTGLMTCYLLSIAGVAPEDIIADYTVSQVYLKPVYDRMRKEMQEHGMPGGMDESFFGTSPANMQKLINYLDEKYGGVLPYLRKIGLSEKIIHQIREKLLTTV